MSSEEIFTGELIGTALLILLGGGVSAAVVLKHSKARSGGWIVVAFGWGLAVMSGAYAANELSGAHLNPAVTLGLSIKSGDWSHVPVYLGGQMAGAMVGAFLVWLTYLGQFQAHLHDPEVLRGTDVDPAGPVTRPVDAPKLPGGPVLGVFATGPEIRNPAQNVITETIATTVLVLVILTLGLNPGLTRSGISLLVVGLLVVSIGLSLGGPTGYAINPARDLGPRIVHALLPLPNKGSSDWSYAWVPVLGPLAGGAAAGGIFRLAF
ncbi:glycerol transporter [Wenjunlia vitaminophila]|uniref:Glycerol transporter n=1 Tax=Wenjunlia vitaminophila TaxID=76728 RepID=A0A0T6LVR2_WENVI|nr:MIP/aquaporin family protein [Wenjunlia vitaminophila]KRV50243.1 glycerol transporter [Wenjunlia vitaminophila]